MLNSIIVRFVAFSFLLLAIASETESINGTLLAKDDDFKYVVSINGRGIPICGGSIIGDDIILTAAECFFKDGEFNDYPYDIFASVLNKYTESPPIKRVVSEICVPSEYVPNEWNDEDNIAVLKLETSLNIEENPHLAKLMLPPKNYVYPEDLEGYVTGYGVNNRNVQEKDYFGYVTGTSDGLLRYGNMKLENSQGPKSKLIRGILVEPPYGSFKGACEGDEGNSFVSNDTALAIVTNNYSCGYGIYSRLTKTAAHVDFIEDVMKGQRTENSRCYKPNEGLGRKIFNFFLKAVESDQHKLKIPNPPATPFDPNISDLRKRIGELGK